MKRLLSAAAALSLLAAGAPANADHKHERKAAAKAHKHADKAHAKAARRAEKAWRKGQHLPAAHRHHYLADRDYGLRAAPAGHRWVLVENDAYLVRTTDGLIAELVLDVLRGRR